MEIVVYLKEKNDLGISVAIHVPHSFEVVFAQQAPVQLVWSLLGVIRANQGSGHAA